MPPLAQPRVRTAGGGVDDPRAGAGFVFGVALEQVGRVELGPFQVRPGHEAIGAVDHEIALVVPHDQHRQRAVDPEAGLEHEDIVRHAAGRTRGGGRG